MKKWDLCPLMYLLLVPNAVVDRQYRSPAINVKCTVEISLPGIKRESDVEIMEVSDDESYSLDPDVERESELDAEDSDNEVSLFPLAVNQPKDLSGNPRGNEDQTDSEGSLSKSSTRTLSGDFGIQKESPWDAIRPSFNLHKNIQQKGQIFPLFNELSANLDNDTHEEFTQEVSNFTLNANHLPETQIPSLKGKRLPDVEVEPSCNTISSLERSLRVSQDAKIAILNIKGLEREQRLLDEIYEREVESSMRRFQSECDKKTLSLQLELLKERNKKKDSDENA
jgi:hypothetical protein